jgi:hypothetical protein
MTRNEALTTFRMLGRKPTLYAMVYLLLIPTFAFIYWSLGDEFYHSTVKYEQLIRQEKPRLVESLRDSIVTSYRRVHDDSWETKDGWRLLVDHVNVSGLVVDQGLYKLDLQMVFENKKANSFYWSLLRATFSPSPLFPQKDAKKYLFALCAENNPSSTPTPTPTPARIPSVRTVTSLIRDQTPMPLDQIFPFDPEAIGGGLFGQTQCPFCDEPCGFLVTSRELMDRLIAYSNTMEGFPSRASGSFDRMLYLSAMTITTVGYGDIVPITRQARMLLALEAILGIVVIGLFLNALAHEMKIS